MKAFIMLSLFCIALFDWGLVLGSDPINEDDDEKSWSGLLEEDEDE